MHFAYVAINLLHRTIKQCILKVRVMTMGFKGLIVDDEALVREVLQEHIPWAQLGIDTVWAASDGRQGLALALEKQVDLIVSDIKMPRMNGIEFAQQVRLSLPGCAFVFLTGYADKQYLKEAIRLKVDRFVEKPIDLEEITNAVREVLAQKTLDGRETFFGAAVNDRVYRAPPEQLAELNRAICQRRRRDACRLLGVMAQEMAQSTATEPDYVRHTFSQALSLLLEAAQNQGLPGIRAEIEALCCGLSRLATFDALKDEVFRVLLRYFDAPGPVEADPLARMEEYLLEHALEETFSIAEMARALCFTATYLSAVYKKRTGNTINGRVTQLRMQRAKELLAATNIKLYEVARRVGYQDGKYFARVFTKEIGINPKQYREKHVDDR